MLQKTMKNKFVHDICYSSSLKTAQFQFLCVVFFVLLSCFCIHHRLFLSNAPMYVRLPYAIPKTFITSDCGSKHRLGNTMFAYASLLGIAHCNNMTAIVQTGIHLMQIFNISAATTDDLDNTMHVYKSYEEYGKRGGAFDISLMELNSKSNVRLFGYLQSWKYFSHLELEIRSNFVFKDDIKKEVQEFFEKTLPVSLEEKSTILVGIHIRRGDMTEGYYQQHGYVTAPAEYFHKAMSYFTSNYSSVQFIVCSDDMSWAKENLASGNVIFSEGHTDAVDLAILSSCDHVIMSVGSYGWWAAWLSNGTTIYYSKWPRPFTHLEYQVEKRDYFPPHWIPIP